MTMKLIKFSLLGDGDPVPLSVELMSNDELDRYLKAEAQAKRERKPAGGSPRPPRRPLAGDGLGRAA